MLTGVQSIMIIRPINLSWALRPELCRENKWKITPQDGTDLTLKIGRQMALTSHFLRIAARWHLPHIEDSR